MPNPITPSPLSDAARAALLPTLQAVLYGLLVLESNARQSYVAANGPTAGILAAVFYEMAAKLGDHALLLGEDMAALGLVPDMTSDGVGNNSPFDGAFSNAEQNPVVLGQELLARCRTLDGLLAAAWNVSTNQGAIGTGHVLHRIAADVLRHGGAIARVLR